MNKIKKLIKKHESFIKYTVGGLFKSILGLTLLYIFIDKLDLGIPNTIIRMCVFLSLFLITFWIYKIIGYSK